MHPTPDHGEDSYVGSDKLRDRVALVTGGDSGIGRAVTIAFAREGADVAIAYYQEHEDAEQTLQWVRREQRRAVSMAVDLSEHRGCRALIDRTVAEFGRIDILVNNAAVQLEEDDFLQADPERIEHTFRTNILAFIYLCQQALPHMRPGSVILNTGSVTALEGHPGLIDYSATKGAIHTFTKSLAQAVADRGIRVNCIAPGPVWTPLIPATLSEDHVRTFGSTTLWHRPAQPAEIAPSYVFLACPDGRYYTGEILAPTGRTTTR